MIAVLLLSIVQARCNSQEFGKPHTLPTLKFILRIKNKQLMMASSKLLAIETKSVYASNEHSTWRKKLAKAKDRFLSILRNLKKGKYIQYTYISMVNHIKYKILIQ
jgi:hypothetical protein